MSPLTIDELHACLLSGKLHAANAMNLETCADKHATRSSKSLIFPGSFNPLHSGHLALADAAEEITARRIEFEISIYNVDKQPLSAGDLRLRLEQFPPQQSVWVTKAARFTDKAQHFPQATFVVGVDTIARIGDAEYYDGDDQKCEHAIELLRKTGSRFLVFGRLFKGEFTALADLNLSDSLRVLCDEVPVDRFRWDISSSDLRIAKRKT